MKLSFLFFFLFLSKALFAQIPEISNADFGYSKKVAKIEIMYYSFEDKFVLDQKKEEYLFNDNGNIIKCRTTFLDDNSSVEKDYFYKDGLLQTIREKKTSSNVKTNSNTTINYTLKNKPEVIVYDHIDYKDIYKITYNEEETISEIFGKFSGNFQYRYFNKLSKNLIKTHLDYYSDNKVTLTEEELFLNDSLIASYSSNENNLKLHTYTKNRKEIYQLDIKDAPKTANEFLSLGDLVEEKNWTIFDFRNVVTTIKDAKLISRELFLKNEKNETIVGGNYDIEKQEVNYLYFTKITYLDGTISGDTEFDYFKVNELKAILK